MRMETKKIVRAFVAGKAASAKRTKTDGNAIFLYNNKIAWRENGKIFATLCGWNTVTTRERLNGLCAELGIGRAFYNHKHKPHFNGVEIGARDVIELT